MTERPGPRRTIDDITEIELAWVAANLGLMRRWVAGTRFLYMSVVIALLLGLAGMSPDTCSLRPPRVSRSR
jgi:hypothetical protein